MAQKLPLLGGSVTFLLQKSNISPLPVVFMMWIWIQNCSNRYRRQGMSFEFVFTFQSLFLGLNFHYDAQAETLYWNTDNISWESSSSKKKTDSLGADLTVLEHIRLTTRGLRVLACRRKGSGTKNGVRLLRKALTPGRRSFETGSSDWDVSRGLRVCDGSRDARVILLR